MVDVNVSGLVTHRCILVYGKYMSVVGQFFLARYGRETTYKKHTYVIIHKLELPHLSYLSQKVQGLVAKFLNPSLSAPLTDHLSNMVIYLSYYPVLWRGNYPVPR